MGDARDAVAWLLRSPARRQPPIAANSAGATAYLRAAIAERARAHQRDVVVIDAFRGEKCAVPQLFVFRDKLVGVWAYGTDNFGRSVKLRPPHRALDAIVLVTPPYCPVYAEPSRFPRTLKLTVSSANDRAPYFYDSSEEYSWRVRPSDDEATSVDDVLALLRVDERADLARRPSSVAAARAAVRRVLRARVPRRPRVGEKEIRAALRPWLLDRWRGVAGALIDELDVDGAIADAVHAAPTGLHVYEIKSEVDTFARLPRQRNVYDRIATSATLVVAPRHVPRALSATLCRRTGGCSSPKATAPASPSASFGPPASRSSA